MVSMALYLFLYPCDGDSGNKDADLTDYVVVARCWSSNPCDGYSSKKDAGLTARSFLCDRYSRKKDAVMVTVARKMLVSLPSSFCVMVTVEAKILGWLQ